MAAPGTEVYIQPRAEHLTPVTLEAFPGKHIAQPLGVASHFMPGDPHQCLRVITREVDNNKNPCLAG